MQVGAQREKPMPPSHLGSWYGPWRHPNTAAQSTQAVASQQIKRKHT